MTARRCHRCRKSRHPGWIMEPTPGQPGDAQWALCPDCQAQERDNAKLSEDSEKRIVEKDSVL